MNFLDTSLSCNVVSLNAHRDELAVSTDSGFELIRLYPVERYVLCDQKKAVGAISVLGHTNLVALSGKIGAPDGFCSSRQVLVYDAKAHREGPKLEFEYDVTALFFHTKMLFIMTVRFVHIYSVVRNDDNHWAIVTKSTKPLVYETVERRGMFAVCGDPDHPMVAFASSRPGWIRVHAHTRSALPVSEIQVADGPISALALNYSGTLLVVADAQGYDLRVYEVATGRKLKEFKRGSSVVNMYSVAFNRQGDRLCCVSDRGTLHVFACDLDPPAPLPPPVVATPSAGPEGATVPGSPVAAGPAGVAAAAAAAPAERPHTLTNRPSMFRSLSLGGYFPVLQAEWSALQHHFLPGAVPGICFFGTPDGAGAEDIIWVVRGDGTMYKLAVQAGPALSVHTQLTGFLASQGTAVPTVPAAAPR